jgi:hypothetical protein
MSLKKMADKAGMSHKQLIDLFKGEPESLW